MELLIHIQEAPIQYENLISQLTSEVDYGAEVQFTGFVRQHDHSTPISHLFLEHYPEVTEAEIKRIVQQAEKKWQLDQVIVVHRIGKIAKGEAIVWVLTRSKHRLDAYAANEFIMDYLKVSAPFWKKELFEDGHEHWVEAKQSDQQQHEKWLK